MNEQMPEGTPIPEVQEITEPVAVEPEVEVGLEPSEGGPGQELPLALREVDRAKLDALKERLAKIRLSEEKTASGSEAPPELAAAAAEGLPVGPTMTGKDVDWSEYDLQYDVRHLYPEAVFRETPQGPKWVAMVDEFHSAHRTFGAYGTKSKGEPLNLGEYLNDMLNSPEGWKMVSIVPLGSERAGLLLHRQVPIVLPDPQPLKKATEVEAPADPELEKVEEDALAFMSREGAVGSLEAQALALNPPTEHVPQPTLSAQAGEAAGVAEVREVVAEALRGEDFGSIEVPEDGV